MNGHAPFTPTSKSDLGAAAIDDEFDTIGEAGATRCQKECSGGDFVRFGSATEGVSAPSTAVTERELHR